MKRIWIAAAALLCAGALVLLPSMGKKPLSDLRISDITATEVHLEPPNTTVVLASTQVERLLPLLQDAKVYKKSSAYKDMAGQGINYTLTTMDGAKVQVMVASPYLVIDGVGYKAKYESCQALSQFANGLLHSLMFPLSPEA